MSEKTLGHVALEAWINDPKLSSNWDGTYILFVNDWERVAQAVIAEAVKRCERWEPDCDGSGICHSRHPEGDYIRVADLIKGANDE